MNNDGILKLLEDVFSTVNDTEDIEKLDLTKDEDYAKFNKYVDECDKICNNDDSVNNLTRLLFSTIFGFDLKDIIKDIKEAGDEIHNEAIKNEKKVPELPSKSVPMDMQLHLHKIVGEYVDTYIRPYGKMDKKVVDDVYAGLFEFACWVINR